MSALGAVSAVGRVRFRRFHCTPLFSTHKSPKRCQNKSCYTSTHYHHKVPLGHLRIPFSTRNVIFSKLKSGVTAQWINDDIRNNTKGTKLTREHLVTKKGINNIRKLEGIRGDANDPVSVSTIVRELPFNPVVLFKQQGEVFPNNILKKEDFLLVLQTELQYDMHGKNGVCIDATYKIND